MSILQDFESNWTNNLELEAIQWEFESKFNCSYAQLKSELIKSFQTKIAYIRSSETSLADLCQKTIESLKIQFYEDNDIKIKELEKIKEELKTEFKIMKTTYLEDQKFISLIQTDDEVKTAYSSYASIYNDYYGELRSKIADLISKSFSPYPYDDSKLLYSVNYVIEPPHLIQYNIENSQKVEINVDFCEKIDRREVFAIQIPNNELFIIGKNFHNESCHACIVDLDSFKLKRILQSIRYPYNAGVLYYQQSIFIFGGAAPYITQSISTRMGIISSISMSNTKITNQRFDLISNKWNSLATLSEILENCSMVPYKHKILISGRDLNEYIYEYDISLGNIERKEKLLITGNSRVYLLASGNIWECKYGNQ